MFCWDNNYLLINQVSKYKQQSDVKRERKYEEAGRDKALVQGLPPSIESRIARNRDTQGAANASARTMSTDFFQCCIQPPSKPLLRRHAEHLNRLIGRSCFSRHKSPSGYCRSEVTVDYIENRYSKWDNSADRV